MSDSSSWYGEDERNMCDVTERWREGWKIKYWWQSPSHAEKPFQLISKQTVICEHFYHRLVSGCDKNDDQSIQNSRLTMAGFVVQLCCDQRNFCFRGSNIREQGYGLGRNCFSTAHKIDFWNSHHIRSHRSTDTKWTRSGYWNCRKVNQLELKLE